MNRFIKSFSNLKLAIFLLLVIAFFSSIGSIIEQDKPIEFYKTTYTTSIFGIPIWFFLTLFGFNQIYTSGWFFLLLILFGTCLLSCTFSRQLPVLKFARRYYFYKYFSQFNKFTDKIQIKKINKTQLCYKFINENYSVCQNKIGFYCHKGLIGRIGPVIVHLSIICILLGSIIGATKGFNGQELIPKSEVFHIQNIIKVGNFAQIPQQTFRINDFWINFNKTGIIQQFYSDISILAGDGKEIQRKTISVNSPFRYQKLTLYQTDWSIIGLRIKVKNATSILQLPVLKISNTLQKVWVSWFPIKIINSQIKINGIIIVLNNVYGKIDLYNENAQFIKSLSLGQTLVFNNFFYIKFIDNLLSTGIQIKSDPGLKIIYIGFTTLIISSFVSYISFSEIWFLESSKKGIFGGKTNRDKIQFTNEIKKIKKSFSNG